MEASHIILLVVSASISFAIGRVIMHMRKIKKNAQKEHEAKKAAQALRDSPPGPESKNKSKRKRQLQQIEKAGKDGV